MEDFPDTKSGSQELHDDQVDAEVIVVGAGPAGLMVAGELRLGGVGVVVVERLTAPSGESRGLGFTARATEVFEQRGLLDRFDSAQTSPQGHFGGLPMDYGVVEGGHFGVRDVPQAQIETVLSAWAGELGSQIRRGVDVKSVTDFGDFVELEVDGVGPPARLRCRYVVGADGGQSTVRQAAEFDFVGTNPTCEMFLADIAGCDLRERFIGEKLRGGMVMAAPLGAGVDRIIVCERGTSPRRRTGPPGFDEVTAAWERLTGQDISTGTPLWVSAFTDATRQATQYRRGRVLLTGDAAHVHLPAGGQGLSLGVQDAANLGWKLAAEVRGWASRDLLDTYHAERHPVGARVLMNTRAQGLLFLSGSEVDPLRAVMAELMELDPVSRLLAGMVSGLDIRYDVGPGEHPLLGLRVPQQELMTESGTTDTRKLLCPARGVLLDLSANCDFLYRTADWADRVDAVAARPCGDGPLRETEALLVRPDGHIAWATPGGGDLNAALHCWFGARGGNTTGEVPAVASSVPQGVARS